MPLLGTFLAFLFSCFRTIQLWIFSVSDDGTKFLKQSAANAGTYKEWKSIQDEIDAVQPKRKKKWFEQPRDKDYDWKTLERAVSELRGYMEERDIDRLLDFTGWFERRNHCRILTSSLYLRSTVRTKALIHEYIDLATETVRFLSREDCVIRDPQYFAARKNDILYLTQKCLGKSTLLLQGGSTFSLCHLGLVKALLEQNLLPQVITASSFSSFVAALVCTTPRERLKKRLDEASFNLTAFDQAKNTTTSYRGTSHADLFTLEGILWRYRRYRDTGHIFDARLIEQCARDNFGDMTFDEAYELTGRILNITIPLSNVEGTPQLLNHITAPYVFIWSAVVATVSTSTIMYRPTPVLCRNFHGEVEKFYAPDYTPGLRDPPIDRIGELFNVNHFVVSEARPYTIPFLRLQRPRLGYWGRFVRTFWSVTNRELLHWVDVAFIFEFLPKFASRILLDESFPVSADWAKIYITPDLKWSHLSRLFEYPTTETIKEWIEIGEKSVWPHMNELKMRLSIELEVERACEIVREQVDERERDRLSL